MPEKLRFEEKPRVAPVGTRRKVLEAAAELLDGPGYPCATIEAIAAKAGVAKTTIYRWWPSIGAMCVDAALALVPDSPPAGRDPNEKITALIVPLEAAARTGNGHAVLRGALMAASDDKDAGDAWRAWVNRDIRQPMRMLLAELAGKRVIRRDFDLDDLIEELLGPLTYRLLIQRAPIYDGFSSEQSNNLLIRYAAT